MSNEEVSLTEGNVYYDIRFHATVPGSEEADRIIVNVEAQNRFHPGYPLVKRALYYVSRMISAQNGTEFSGGKNQNLRKVYSIWVCTHPAREWQNNVTRCAVREEKLLGSAREKPDNYDLMTVVMVCLGRGADAEPMDSDYAPLLKMLEVLFTQRFSAQEKQRILSEHYDIQFTGTMEEEAESMCNLSEDVFEEGWELGNGQGIEQGRLLMLFDLVKNGVLAQASESAHLSQCDFIEKMNDPGYSHA